MKKTNTNGFNVKQFTIWLAALIIGGILIQSIPVSSDKKAADAVPPEEIPADSRRTSSKAETAEKD